MTKVVGLASIVLWRAICVILNFQIIWTEQHIPDPVTPLSNNQAGIISEDNGLF